MGHHLRNIFRLQEQFRPIGARFLFKELGEARCGGAAGVNAEHTDAVWVDIFAQAVGCC